MAEAPPPAIDPAIEADPEVNRLLAALQLMVRIADCMSQLSTDESDSTLGDDVSIQNYPVENNRRLCRLLHLPPRAELTDSDGKLQGRMCVRTQQLDRACFTDTTVLPAYVMPNDEAELDRLDLTHQKLRILLDNKLLLSPVENPGRLLDVGTGTGIWAIEYGTRRPTTTAVSHAG
ncbi:MAG: hypothetical protein L6R40_006765 [Gallowayella cf. fulva]|nr:MAG: hypothetical protein L6R40_006765 [Xanthomendoza cf. fulva]